jgi:hypothetical protein
VECRGVEYFTDRIRFEFDFRPISAEDQEDDFIEIHASNSKLIEIANRFRDELVKCPERK